MTPDVGWRSALLLGGCATLAGVGLLAAPELASAIGLPTVLQLFAVAGIGVLALLLAGLVGQPGRLLGAEGDDRPRRPHVGSRPAYPPHASDVTERLADITWSGTRTDGQAPRDRFRADLRDLATRTLARTENRSVADVVADLDDGRWTDDAEAAAYLAGEPSPGAAARTKLAAVLGRAEPPTRRRALRAVAALAERVTGATVDADSSADRGRSGDRPASVAAYRAAREGAETGWRIDAALRPFAGVGFGLAGVGVLSGASSVFVLAALPAVALLAARLDRPAVSTVDVERTVSPADPDPGDSVTVRLRLHSTGPGSVPDCRVVDGVPPGLEVNEGAARTAVTLRSGRAATVEYTVTARPGVHTFDPPLLVCRGVTGFASREVRPRAPETTIECPATGNRRESLRVRDQPTLQPANATPEVTGAGVEFDGLREYRPGDPPTRVDWNRRARTGDLVTVEFLESRAPRVVVLVDSRRAAYVDAGDGVPAARRAARVGGRIADDLLAQSVPVGLAALGPRECWMSPAVGAAHRRRLRTRLETDPAVGWEPSADGSDEGRDSLQHLVTRLRPDTQVCLCSPLTDDEVVAVARRLQTHGHLVSVSAVDPWRDRDRLSPAEGFAVLERLHRVAELRRAGVPVHSSRAVGGGG